MGRKQFNWLPEHDALLGTMTDSAAAEIIGVAIVTVFNRRQYLGIKPSINCDHHDKPFNEWLRDELNRQGISQAKAAKIFECSVSLIEAWIAGPEKSWGRTPSKIEKSGIFAILRVRRGRK